MKISTLLEAVTAADLFRRIDGLDAMIKDPATTSGEKTNAAELKKRLQDRISREFPGATKTQTAGIGPAEYEFWTRMSNAAQAEKELQDLKQSNPEAYRKRMLEKLDKMKQTLSNMRKRHVPGNVETAYEIKEFSRKLDNFIRKEFPEKWAELEAKREAARSKSYARQDQKRTEKEKAGRKAVKAEQKGTFNTVGKQYGPALRELYNALLGVKFRAYGFPAEMGKGTSKWESSAAFLRRLVFVPTGEIRKKWNQMDSAIQSDLRSAIEGVNTQGANFQGFTKAQKDSLLTAMSAYKK
jgi:hypothetical protein